MQRKPGFPVANSNIKMPEMLTEVTQFNDDESGKQRLQLVNFGHSQWGFNNWSWAVTKQEVDFVDFINGNYCAGVAAYVNVTIKSFDIHRENVGYATSVSHCKGLAVYKSRKSAVTNALRETLLSFGGSVTTELKDLLEAQRHDIGATANSQPDILPTENNQNIANRPTEPKNSAHNRQVRKDSVDVPPTALRSPHTVAPIPQAPPAVRNAPTAKTLPRGAPPHGPPANRQGPAPRAPPPPTGARPNSNEGVKSAELGEEEARAERKRRQRQAQEEFRQKQLILKQNIEVKPETSSRNSSSFDKLLMDIPTQDIIIESTDDTSKRKSPCPEGGVPKKRTGSISKLDIVNN